MSQISFRVSDKIKEELAAKASKQNLTLGEYCRQILEEALVEKSLREEIKSLRKLSVRANIGVNMIGIRDNKEFVKLLTKAVNEYFEDEEKNEKKQ